MLGEHFVVYGLSSIIASIDRSITITIKNYLTEANDIKIHSNLCSGSKNNIIGSKNSLEIEKSSIDVVTKLKKIIRYLKTRNDLNGKQFSDLTIDLNSEIPIGGGLGSSSALCVGLAGAFYYFKHTRLDRKNICLQAINAEKIINKDTSGADCSICTFGGIGTYDKVCGFKSFDMDFSDINFLVINSGYVHDTYEMVKRVKKYKEKFPVLFKSICEDYNSINKLALTALKNKNFELFGSLLNKNQELLTKLNVSNEIIDKIISICNSNGSIGTKITGAGGGGSVISLIDKNEPYILRNIINKLNDLKIKYSISKIDKEGLKIKQ